MTKSVLVGIGVIVFILATVILGFFLFGLDQDTEDIILITPESLQQKADLSTSNYDLSGTEFTSPFTCIYNSQRSLSDYSVNFTCYSDNGNHLALYGYGYDKEYALKDFKDVLGKLGYDASQYEFTIDKENISTKSQPDFVPPSDPYPSEVVAEVRDVNLYSIDISEDCLNYEVDLNRTLCLVKLAIDEKNTEFCQEISNYKIIESGCYIAYAGVCGEEEYGWTLNSDRCISMVEGEKNNCPFREWGDCIYSQFFY